MRTEMIIRVQTSSEKGAGCKAIKVAAGIKGVESVTLAGEDRNLLLVIAVGVDSNRVTKKLRQKVGHAEVVELRTVDAPDDRFGLVRADHAYRYHPTRSPYRHQQQYAGGSTYALAASSGGRDYYYDGGGGGGGYYPAAQYQQQQALYQYQPAPGNVHTVVHHEYASDPNGCSVM